MKTFYFTSMVLLFCVTNSTFSQVGVNTIAPNSTLDVVATNATGTTTNVDGLIIPRVTRQRAQSMASVLTSTMIYVSEVVTGTATGTTINVTAIGFYYYDGTVWQPFKTTIPSIKTTINESVTASSLNSGAAINLGMNGWSYGGWTSTASIEKYILATSGTGTYQPSAATTLSNLLLNGWINVSTTSGAATTGTATIYIMKYSLGSTSFTSTATAAPTVVASQAVSLSTNNTTYPVSISASSVSLAAGDVLVCWLLNTGGNTRWFEFGGQLQFTN